MNKENTDLTIEAIKLVELLSSLNIEDFQMNQWIFLIDGYGMQQLDSEAATHKSMPMSGNGKLQDLKSQLNSKSQTIPQQ